jgi:hypothetical protein
MQRAPALPQISSILQGWWKFPSIRIPVLIFIAARFLTLVVGATAVQLGPVHNPYASGPIFLASMQARQPLGLISILVDPWHRGDTGWYLKIAEQGYAAGDGSIIFAPLYPALMAATGLIVGDKLLGGLLVSSIACLAFLVILYQLALRETGSDQIAWNALLALAAFPTAFYLLAGYTEATFMAFAAGALLAARDKRWWMVVPLAICASLTRLQGWILFFPIGWLAFANPPRFWLAQDIGWIARLRQAVPRLAATAAGPLASLSFMLYTSLSGLGSISDAYTKDPWRLLIRPPWSVVIDAISRVVAGQAGLTEIAGLAALAIIVAFALASLRVLPVFYHLYLWPTLVFILLRYYPLVPVQRHDALRTGLFPHFHHRRRDPEQACPLAGALDWARPDPASRDVIPVCLLAVDCLRTIDSSSRKIQIRSSSDIQAIVYNRARWNGSWET